MVNEMIMSWAFQKVLQAQIYSKENIDMSVEIRKCNCDEQIENVIHLPKYETRAILNPIATMCQPHLQSLKIFEPLQNQKPKGKKR